MEPEPHFEDFRNLRRKIFQWQGDLSPCACVCYCSYWQSAAVAGYRSHLGYYQQL